MDKGKLLNSIGEEIDYYDHEAMLASERMNELMELREEVNACDEVTKEMEDRLHE